MLKILIEKSTLGPIETKRAAGYLFALLTETAEFHSKIAEAGGLEFIISLASLVDLECQEYAAFALAFLASNRQYQITLAKMGAVRPLVSMMAGNKESKHYSGLALLKLADNFENHITIAEEGGIQALLRLGRSRVTGEELQYKAAMTVGHLASNAIDSLPKSSRFKND